MSELLEIASSEAHRICIYGEDILVERRVDPNNIPHMMIYLEL